MTEPQSPPPQLPALAETAAAAAAEPVIVVKNVVKAFGDHVVLNDVSFHVNAGETVSILGRSGTGKSVMLKTIIALMDPDEGQVLVLGRDLHTLDEQARLTARKDLGYVFQGAALFDSLSVLENVGFSLYQQRRKESEIRKIVLDRLDAVGLKDAVDKYPSELSGGMQKRVGLARAIVGEPSIILYDEPTTGLDPLTTDVINRIIIDLRKRLKVTSLVVTHDIRSALAISDRLVMLDQGKVVIIGTPDEVSASPNPWVQRFLGLHPVDYSKPADLSGPNAADFHPAAAQHPAAAPHPATAPTPT